MMKFVTAAEITSLFLYGSTSPPSGSALASPALPNHSSGQLPLINFEQFMTQGPGKFANPSRKIGENRGRFPFFGVRFGRR
jgi:hypothetical protein